MEPKLRNGETSLLVIGHRGCGENLQQSPGEISASRPSIMENTKTSFNAAAVHGADFVEFDVQVTKDGCPVLFHDDLLVALVKGEYVMKSISEVSLEEFFSFGHKENSSKTDKQLYRKRADGSVSAWTVSIEDSFCTLEEAFELVSPLVGFNIELKFDSGEMDTVVFSRAIDATMQVVNRCAGGRKIFFSSFHPDAALILKKKQNTYPVFFLTDGGVEIFVDSRRNSIEAAIEVCLNGELQGIACQVRALLENAGAVAKIHSAGLYVLTWGKLNNLTEVVRKQQEAGVDGVIVDNVAEVVGEVQKRKRLSGRIGSTDDQSVSGLKPLSTGVPSPLVQRAVRAA